MGNMTPEAGCIILGLLSHGVKEGYLYARWKSGDGVVTADTYLIIINDAQSG